MASSIRIAVPLMLLMAVVALGGWMALEAQTVIPSRSLEDERAALERANDEAKAAGRRSEALEARAERATAEAERARREAQALAARIQQAEANIEAAEARVAIVEKLQKRQRARLAERQGPIVRLTAALQMMARRPTALSLVQPGSLDDMVRVRAVMATVVPRIEQQTGALRQEVARGRDLRAQADRAAQSLRDGRADLAERRDALARLETERRVESRQLASEARFEEDRAIGLSEQARDIGDLMERIRENASVRERLAALDGPLLRPPRPSESQVIEGNRARPKTGRPAYQLPAIGDIVTGFGEISASGVRSRGLTIATRPEAQLVAPASGRIAFAGPYRGFGNIVIIEHGSGWTSLITNLSNVSARVGDEVDQGAPIGLSVRDRPAITVELRRNGQPIDIAALIG
ncbi:MAG: peptidoglycan DD-metalloendopeptidase family protein [Blastomonas sp.]